MDGLSPAAQNATHISNLGRVMAQELSFWPLWPHWPR